MGLNRKPVKRIHKLQDEVMDTIPKKERILGKDEILQDSPGAYGAKRGIRRRQDSDFGADILSRKLELAWEVDVDIERVDFGGGDTGLRITLPSSSVLLPRGVQEEDELRILAEISELSAKRYDFIEEVNTGDVAAGKVRIVSSTVWRLPDDALWSDELGVRVRIELGAGVRL